MDQRPIYGNRGETSGLGTTVRSSGYVSLFSQPACPSVSLAMCLSACLNRTYPRPSVCPPIRPPTRLSTYPPGHLPARTPTRPSAYPLVCLPARPPTRPSAYPPSYPPSCLTAPIMFTQHGKGRHINADTYSLEPKEPPNTTEHT